MGNFDSVTTDGGTAVTRTANAQNEITSIGGATMPTYDANGNMTGDETGKTFVYDAWNRLVAVKSGATTLETFGYDGLNRRVTNPVGSTTTDLFYSDQWQVLEEKQGSNTTARYVWSPVYVDALVLRDRDTDGNGNLDERLWVQQDANWNVTAVVGLVSGSWVVVERYVYDPYGSQTIYSPTYSVRGSSLFSMVYGFQGMQYDSISGLNATERRWYSPILSVWTSNDPSGLSAGDNDLFRYEDNNPTDENDESGLKPTKVSVKSMKYQMGAYGLVVWPVTFALDDKSDPCVGGWIIQHLVVTVSAFTQGKQKKIVKTVDAGMSKDYYEAWRVDPRKNISDEKGNLQWIMAKLPNVIQGQLSHIDLTVRNQTANDWYAHPSVPKASRGDKGGSIAYDGTVFYIDGLQSLPSAWSSGGVPEAGSLLSVDASNRAATVGFFMQIAAGGGVPDQPQLLQGIKPSMTGTTPHQFTIEWDHGGKPKNPPAKNP